MTKDVTALRELLRVIQATRADEIDCDALLAAAGALVEATQAGTPVPPELRLALQHLEVCAECREEFAALRDAIGD